MEIHLTLNKSGSNRVVAYFDILSSLWGRPMEEKDTLAFFNATWNKGIHAMYKDLSNFIGQRTENIWSMEDMVPATVFGELLEFPDC